MKGGTVDCRYYWECMLAIDRYFNTGEPDLNVIHTYLADREFWRFVAEKTLKEKEEKIVLFKPEEQIMLVRMAIVRMAYDSKWTARVFALLPYISIKEMDNVLVGIDHKVLERMVEETKTIISSIGHREIDNPRNYWLRTTTIISRIKERLFWYRVIQKINSIESSKF